MIEIIITILLVIGGLFILVSLTNRLIAKNPQKRFVILIVAFLFAVVLVFLVPTFILLKSFKVFSLYSTIEKSLIQTIGISQWLAKGILLIAFIPFIILPKWFFSFRKTKRRAARAIFTLYTAGYYLAMYFLTQNIYFAHGTGEAIKYYAVTPEGYRFFDSPGYDSKYGIKLEKVTPDIARVYEMTKGVPISSTPSNPDTMSAFFDRYTGAPATWYLQRPDGSFEFFKNPGYHPKYGTPLKPVTPEIVEQVEAQKAKLKVEEMRQSQQKEFEARLQKYLNPSAKTLAGKKSILLMVIDEANGSRKQNREYENDLKSLLMSHGLLIATGLFTPNFFADGYADALCGGQSKILNELLVNRYVDYLLLVQQKTDFSQDERLGGLISTKVNVNYQILRSKGQLIKGENLTESGIGSSEEEAVRNALSRITDRIIPSLKSL
jgi:hypothetical protein